MLTSESNKAISNRPPSDYLNNVMKAVGSNLDAWLESNLFSNAAFQAALKNDYDGFVDERCKTIDTRASALTDW